MTHDLSHVVPAHQCKEAVESPVVVHEWFPVARTGAIREGQLYAVRLLGTDLVLWRCNSGSPMADGRVIVWQDSCVHRGTRLSLGRVEDGHLICPYHGWRYDETGHCVQIPAHPDQAPPEKARVRAYRAEERYGLVWVSLGDPRHDIPPFPEENNPAYRKILVGPGNVVRASAPRIIENFLDVAHFPFVHGGSLGDPKRPEITDYTVEASPDGITVRDVRVYQPDPYGTGVGDDVTYVYRVLRPLVAYLTKETKTGSRFALMLLVTPHDETSTTPWFYMAVDAQVLLPDEDLALFQNKIFEQDRAIVESQRPALLPLNVQAELHLRSDRTAIAYRRWLKELGMTFGTVWR